MKDKIKNKVLVAIVGLVGLFSVLCLSQGYRAELMPSLSDTLPGKLSVSSKVYNSDDSKKYLDRDLVSRGVQPIQVTIQNHTAHTYWIDDMNMPQMESSDVAMKVTKEKIPRAVGYRIAALIFWPFALPAAADGIRTINAHAKMKNDYEARSIKTEAILPYSTVNRVMFVSQEHVKDDLHLTFYNQSNGRGENFKMTLKNPGVEKTKPNTAEIG